MKNNQRIVYRIGAVALILLGIYGLMTADLDIDKDSTYRVTSYNARTREMISSQIKEGKDIILNKRFGCLICIGLGLGVLWFTRSKTCE